MKFVIKEISAFLFLNKNDNIKDNNKRIVKNCKKYSVKLANSNKVPPF